jgi:hypothetical protein
LTDADRHYLGLRRIQAVSGLDHLQEFEVTERRCDIRPRTSSHKVEALKRRRWFSRAASNCCAPVLQTPGRSLQQIGASEHAKRVRGKVIEETVEPGIHQRQQVLDPETSPGDRFVVILRTGWLAG